MGFCRAVVRGSGRPGSAGQDWLGCGCHTPVSVHTSGRVVDAAVLSLSTFRPAPLGVSHEGRREGLSVVCDSSLDAWSVLLSNLLSCGRVVLWTCKIQQQLELVAGMCWSCSVVWLVGWCSLQRGCFHCHSTSDCVCRVVLWVFHGGLSSGLRCTWHGTTPLIMCGWGYHIVYTTGPGPSMLWSQQHSVAFWAMHTVRGTKHACSGFCTFTSVLAGTATAMIASH